MKNDNVVKNSEKSIVISIVVPVYNAQKFLTSCVESLINQTIKYKYEIILVNDGSTDDSLNICNDFAYNYENVRVINKINQGVSATRLVGVESAKGNYILCVDADDVVSNKLVEEMMSIIEKYHSDVICFNYNNVSETGKLIYTQKNNFSGYFKKTDLEKIYNQLIKDSKGNQFPPSIWSKCIKKELLLKCMKEMDNRIKIGEDMCLTANCLYKSESMYFVDKPLYDYRWNALSVTKRKKSFPWTDVEYKIEFLEKILPLDEYDFYNQICRMTVHSLFNVACSVIQEQRNYNISKKIIRKNLNNKKFYKYVVDCKFISLKEKFALYAIKHQNIFLINLYCKFI